MDLTLLSLSIKISEFEFFPYDSYTPSTLKVRCYQSVQDTFSYQLSIFGLLLFFVLLFFCFFFFCFSFFLHFTSFFLGGGVEGERGGYSTLQTPLPYQTVNGPFIK